MDEACEVCGAPVVSGGEAAEVFKLAEAAFDAVALLVGGDVVRDDDPAGTVCEGITAVVPVAVMIARKALLS